MRRFVLAMTTLAFGCSSDTPKRSDAPSTFTPDEPPRSGPSVFLRGRPANGMRVTVDVVAHGLERAIHGAAFRLHWDPATLGFDEARRGDGWSREALAIAHEGAPGELVVVWTEKGTTPGLSAADETILGTLDFTEKSSDGAPLEFRTERSTIRDDNGASLTVAWRGGRVGACTASAATPPSCASCPPDR
jgi:hypothetical protein